MCAPRTPRRLCTVASDVPGASFVNVSSDEKSTRWLGPQPGKATNTAARNVRRRIVLPAAVEAGLRLRHIPQARLLLVHELPSPIQRFLRLQLLDLPRI